MPEEGQELQGRKTRRDFATQFESIAYFYTAFAFLALLAALFASLRLGCHELADNYVIYDAPDFPFFLLDDSTWYVAAVSILWPMFMIFSAAAKSLWSRTSYARCVVLSSASCVLFPIGTILGIVSLIFLRRARAAGVFAQENPSLRDWMGQTPLHWACGNRDVDRVRILIEAGADVDARATALVGFVRRHGVTPLHMAASQGNTDTALALIEAGAVVNAQDYEGQSPLHYAVSWHNVEGVRLFLVKGANANLMDRFGNTALDLAEKGEPYAIADLLRQHGAKTAKELEEEEAKAAGVQDE